MLLELPLPSAGDRWFLTKMPFPSAGERCFLKKAYTLCGEGREKEGVITSLNFFNSP